MTVETLQAKLHEMDDGVLRNGSHQSPMLLQRRKASQNNWQRREKAVGMARLYNGGSVELHVNLDTCEKGDPCAYDHTCRIHKLAWYLKSVGCLPDKTCADKLRDRQQPASPGPEGVSK